MKNLKGIDEISEYTGLRIITIITLKNDYDLPMSRGTDAIWMATTKELNTWLNNMGLKDWNELTIAKINAAFYRKNRQGPGKIIKGDFIKLCNELNRAPGSIIDYLTYPQCPILKIADSNQYSVDFNRWEDFLEDVENASSVKNNKQKQRAW